MLVIVILKQNVRCPIPLLKYHLDSNMVLWIDTAVVVISSDFNAQPEHLPDAERHVGADFLSQSTGGTMEIASSMIVPTTICFWLRSIYFRERYRLTWCSLRLHSVGPTLITLSSVTGGVE